jgi:23S rRNA pseudouridine1911/1915/1917 synthase
MIPSPFHFFAKRHHNKWLVLIAAYKLLQALLIGLIGLGARHLLHKDVGDELSNLADHLHFNSEWRLVSFILDKAELIHDPLLRRIGFVAFCYSAISAVEGIGLYFEKSGPSTLPSPSPHRFCPGRSSRSCRRCHSLHSNYMLNRGYAYTTIISSKYHGQTLLSHLASLYPHSTPQAWQQKLNNGEVTLNGVTATGSESVTSGQTLVWNRPPWIEPDSPQHFEVLFEDPHLLAVNKPSGLPTLPGGGFMENTLLRLVQKQTPNANPVHRLGRATTGIVLFAKTPQAASNLFANWNTPKIQKIYRALAQNIAQHDAYEILTPIGLVPHPLIGSVWAANPSGKPSKSLAKVISRTTSTTTFEVSLNSGRPHQIRIHLASIGHPLVGDPLYGLTGQPLENLPGLPGDGGYFLHAQFLKFHHPITGEQINLEAALPSGFSLHQ